MKIGYESDLLSFRNHIQKPGAYIPLGYKSILSIHETQDALDIIKNVFNKELSKQLSLQKVISPILTEMGLGLQDNLKGIERPVEFDSPPVGKNIQILQDNCKWRRSYLTKHNFASDTGILTNLDAGIRRDEAILDNTHSIIINNITWEKVIRVEDRNMNYLRGIISKLIGTLFVAQEELRCRYPQLPRYISEDVSFITTQELEDVFPELTPPEREYEWGMEHNIFCLTQIGHTLKSGKPHGERSPDYDDWSLNFDIFIKYPPLNQVIEIGGGGIRIMGKEMLEQIQIANWEHNIDTPYHNSIINNTMLSTIGGAFGGDRIGMILTGKVHIAETRPSVWDEQTLKECKNAGVDIM